MFYIFAEPEYADEDNITHRRATPKVIAIGIPNKICVPIAIWVKFLYFRC
jgi:cephalosporin-C deacetylase-like acetyl esterase